MTTRVHPSATGRDGLPLFLDTASIGPRDARNALLLISGTHGVEGYFGSGVETGLLREGIADRVPPGARLVMLHALNPYGFSWDRRVNEDNADVNRNFVNHSIPPVNDDYANLADAIAPKDISPAGMKAANLRLRDYARTHGDFALQAALSSGQYAFADGIYFGGACRSWSSLMLEDVLREELAGVENLVVIDFHTGLGEPGAAEMIVEDQPDSPAYARARAIWGDTVQLDGRWRFAVGAADRHDRCGDVGLDGGARPSPLPRSKSARGPCATCSRRCARTIGCICMAASIILTPL